MRGCVVPLHNHNLQRATSPPAPDYTTNEDSAAESDVSQVSTARGEANSTPNCKDKLKEEIREIILEMIRSGELTPP
ncbi:hypothetical protein McpSp1_09230 [Methanocorpusculaceae archaeon Sp1]|nr:hypothetical protein [Methanocorpusculaceae archaeon Sp1]